MTTKRAFVALLASTALAATGCSGGDSRGRPLASPTSTGSGSPTPAATTAAKPAARAPWPLTGLPRPAGPARPAVSVKIDNSHQAHPQSGLDKADLVVDTPVEGGLSRLFAVFHSQSSDLVGPIRSARPVDAALLRALYGGIFAYSGAAEGEIAPVRASSAAVLLSRDNDPTPFLILHSRRAPQNVYANTSSLLAAASRRTGFTRLRPPPQLFTYGRPAAPAAPASSVTVHLSGVTRAGWAYRGSGYVRSQDGAPDVLAQGQQVRATNVVVLRVSVTGSGIFDAAHNEDPFVHVVGAGVAQVFRDGVVQTGRWSRPTLTSAMTLRTVSGSTMTLHPGSTWVELVPAASGSVSVP